MKKLLSRECVKDGEDHIFGLRSLYHREKERGQIGQDNPMYHMPLMPRSVDFPFYGFHPIQP